jgi:hypothetical protein
MLAPTTMSYSGVMYAGVCIAWINGRAGDPELRNAKVVVEGECRWHLTTKLGKSRFVDTRCESLLL